MQYNSVCRQTALIRLSKKKQISNFGCDLDQLRYTRKGNRNKSESQEAAVQRIRPDNSKRRHQIDPNRMFGLALRYLLPKTSLKKPYLSGLRPLSSATSATKPSIAGKTSGSTSKLGVNLPSVCTGHWPAADERKRQTTQVGKQCTNQNNTRQTARQVVQTATLLSYDLLPINPRPSFSERSFHMENASR